MQTDRQARIRERAYQIWLAEGRVEGRQDEHWQRAEREIAEEEARASSPVGRGAGAAEAEGGTPSPNRSRAKPGTGGKAKPRGRGTPKS